MLRTNTAQKQSHRQIGQQLSNRIDWNAETRTTTNITTFTFPDEPNEPLITLEFVAHYTNQLPTQPPSTIDLITTQQAVNENRPDMTMTIDKRDVPLIPQPRTNHSMMATLPFDAFLSLTNAQQIVKRTFNTELEFGSEQITMLQSMAAR